MKTQFASGLILVIGLIAGLVSAIAMSLISNPVQAEQPDSSKPTIPLKQPESNTLVQQFPEFTDIDLTPQQQEQIKTIIQDMQPEFEAILPHPELTPEQQNQLNSGQSIRIAIPEPTPEQKEKLRQVVQTYQQKVEAVLTPEQREQLHQNQNKD